MKYLVTGASGLIGRHLVEHLAGQGHQVVAASRSVPGFSGSSVSSLAGTVADSQTAEGWIKDHKPDVIIHLAAQSLPRVSWEDPAGTYEVNINGTMNLLKALKEQEHSARFIVMSSSSIYAPSADSSPIREDGKLAGSSPYALSKLAAEQGAMLYGKQFGLDVVSVRPFFIIGPHKVGDVSSDFARRIVKVERGELDKITVGNLDAVRDFLDISDGVSGIEKIIAEGESGQAYNLCSGKGASIRDVLEHFKTLATVEVREELDENLIRPLDEPVKIGDPSKLTAMGWKPDVSLEESLRSILEFWRARD